MIEHCSSPVTKYSQALADKAESEGTLIQLDGQLYCECGERGSAYRKPTTNGSVGDKWYLTLHYPKKISLKPVNPSGKPEGRNKRPPR